MEEPALCIGCNEATPRFRERKDPTRVFCGAECRKSFYAAPIGRGIFELLIVKPNLPTDIDYEIFMAAALNEASNTQYPVPVHRRFEKLVRYLTKQLHELLAGPLPHIPQRLEKENAVLDLFFATANSQAVLAHFGVAQDRLKLDVFSMALHSLSVQLVVRMSARYGVDPYNLSLSLYATTHRQNPFSALTMSAKRLEVTQTLEGVHELRQRAATIAAHLAKRPDFRSLHLIMDQDRVQTIKKDMMELLLADARQLELVATFLANKNFPHSNNYLRAAVWSHSIDMVRLVEPHASKDLFEEVTPALVALCKDANASPAFRMEVVTLLMQANKRRIVENDVLFELEWRTMEKDFLLFMISRSEPDEGVLSVALKQGADLSLIQAIVTTADPLELTPDVIEMVFLDVVRVYSNTLLTRNDMIAVFIKERAETLQYLAPRCEHAALLTTLLQREYLHVLVVASRASKFHRAEENRLDVLLAETANVPLIVAMEQADMLGARWDGQDADFSLRQGWTIKMMHKLMVAAHVDQAFALLDAAQAWSPACSPQNILERILYARDPDHRPLVFELLRRYPINVDTAVWITMMRKTAEPNPFREMMFEYATRVAREAAERRRAPEPGRGIDDEDDDNDEDDNNNEEEKPKAPRLRSMIKV